MKTRITIKNQKSTEIITTMSKVLLTVLPTLLLTVVNIVITTRKLQNNTVQTTIKITIIKNQLSTKIITTKSKARFNIMIEVKAPRTTRENTIKF